VFLDRRAGRSCSPRLQCGAGVPGQEISDGAFIEQKNPDVLWEVPLGVVVLFTLRGIGDYVQNYYPSWVGRQVIKGLRRDVFSHYLRLPTAYLDRSSPATCSPSSPTTSSWWRRRRPTRDFPHQRQPDHRGAARARCSI
jgi:ABC-type multidrug transport system fused ATPase/permease subunit